MTILEQLVSLQEEVQQEITDCRQPPHNAAANNIADMLVVWQQTIKAAKETIEARNTLLAHIRSSMLTAVDAAETACRQPDANAVLILADLRGAVDYVLPTKKNKK